MDLLEEVRISPKTGSLKDDQMFEDYFREFRHLKEAPVKILELGVCNGKSLKIWDEYFPNGAVFGIDCKISFGLRGQRKVRYFIGQQEDVAFLDKVATKVAPEGFDIIIDDCSHVGELTKISFWHLFENHLKPGGIYAIEDWLTAYIPSWEDGCALTYDPKDRPPDDGEFSGHRNGMAGFLKELVDELARRVFFVPQPDPTRRSRIAQIKFLDNLVFVYRAAE